MSFLHEADPRPPAADGRVSVVHVLASLDARQGGPSRSVVQLVDALADRPGLDVTLVSQTRAGDICAWPERANSVPAESASRTALTLGVPARRALGRIVAARRPALIHSHGLWLPVNHWASGAGRSFGVPVIIHPRGMLEPWAVAFKPWRKRVAMTIFQRRDLAGAAALIATSAAEHESIRRLKFRQPVAIIPNGVRSAPLKVASAGTPPARDGPRTVLFLSRIHPKKGLLNLLQAWHDLGPKGWRLVIAGPDDGGHLAKVLEKVRELGLEGSVRYVGAVDGEAKEEAYRDADLFVLPTFSENFGIVVAEALAHGVPVVTTRGAPWPDLERFGCGWWADIGVEPLSRALRAAMALSDDERGAMGERGRDYVRRYDWDEIARQTVALYEWVLGRRERPECVRLD